MKQVLIPEIGDIVATRKPVVLLEDADYDEINFNAGAVFVVTERYTECILLQQDARTYSLAVNVVPQERDCVTFAKLLAVFSETFAPVRLDLVEHLTASPRIIAYVDGGNVQAAKADQPVFFKVLDFDNKRASDPSIDDDYKELFVDMDQEYEALPITVY